MKRLMIAFICVVCAGCVYSGPRKKKVNWDKVNQILGNPSKQFTKEDAYKYQSMGIASFEQQLWKISVINFEKAVSLDPSLYLSWYHLGLLRVDTLEGNQCFRKAIKLNPDFALSYFWLAYSYCRMDKEKDAIPLFEKYIEIAKGDEDESGRVEVAEGVLQELRNEIPGKYLTQLKNVPFSNLVESNTEE